MRGLSTQFRSRRADRARPQAYRDRRPARHRRSHLGVLFLPGLSQAGTRVGLGARSRLVWSFLDLVSALADEARAPRTVVLENLVGLLSHKEGSDFVSVCRAPAAAGYRVDAAIDAALFVPQSRRRVFVVAARGDDRLSAELFAAGPDPLWRPPRLQALAARLAASDLRRWVWCRLPAPPSCGTRLIDIPEAGAGDLGWDPSRDAAERLQRMAPRHRKAFEETCGDAPMTVGISGQRTRRDGRRVEVRCDRAPCFVTPKGGAATPRLLTVERNTLRSRQFSSREGACPKGPPDSFQLPPRYVDAARVTGDGVVVPVVRYLSQHLLEPPAAALRQERVAEKPSGQPVPSGRSAALAVSLEPQRADGAILESFTRPYVAECGRNRSMPRLLHNVRETGATRGGAGREP
jgi:DNA (cytosine-5)-methyltransferase 1